MATYLLVPGGWQGGWAFDPVVTPLRSAGHTVHALDLPHTGRENLDDHIAHVRHALADIEEPVVLCGHSYAGMVISGVADKAPERIAHLVYADAFVPADGQSWWDLANEHFRDLVLAGARADGRTVAVPAGLDPRARPHSLASFLQAIRLTGAQRGVPRRTLVFASGWPASPFHAQFARLRDDPAWVTHELPTGHNLMRVATTELTGILLDAA